MTGSTGFVKNNSFVNCSVDYSVNTNMEKPWVLEKTETARCYCNTKRSDRENRRNKCGKFQPSITKFNLVGSLGFELMNNSPKNDFKISIQNCRVTANA